MEQSADSGYRRLSWYWAGLLASVLTLACCFVILLVLGLYPRLPAPLGPGVDPGGWTGRLHAAALIGWNSQETVSQALDGTHVVGSRSGVDFVGLAVLVVVLTGVGWVVRRVVPPSLGERTLALAVTALANAGIVTLLAARLQYTTRMEAPPAYSGSTIRHPFITPTTQPRSSGRHWC